MPLTYKGKKILERFKKKYGEEKGEDFFYAYINKHPKQTKSWHE